MLAVDSQSSSRRWPEVTRIWICLELVLFIGALVGTQVLSNNLWMLPNGDVDEYYAYAQAFWTSHPLFHSIPVEYPLLAIIPFSLTMLPNLPHSYHIVFAIWMGALVVAGYIGFLRFADHTRALMYVVYLLLGTSATLLARFDIVPALATLAALWLAERGRFTYAYIFIAAGVLLKLYPAFLIPVIVIEQWRQTNATDRAEGVTGPQPQAADRQRADLW